MLSRDLIKKIKSLHIKSDHIVNTMMAGQYRSVFRGSGIEFEEVREYSPGDDVKSIDWKVSARFGKPYVKLYREERELVVMLLLDMSESLNFGTNNRLKKEAAAEIASILAFNAVRNNDKVGAILFTDRVEKYIPPKKGSSHVWRVIKEFFMFNPQHKKTNIKEAVKYLGNLSGKRTVVFLISDYLASGYLKDLKTASKKHTVIAVILTDPGEFTLADKGLMRCRDLETGQILTFDASDPKTRRHYRLIKEDTYNQTLAALRQADIDTIAISTADSAADALIAYFGKKKRAHG